MSPGWEHLITWMNPSVGHLNSILARVGGNLKDNFQKSQMPGGGGMLKLWFDRNINVLPGSHKIMHAIKTSVQWILDHASLIWSYSICHLMCLFKVFAFFRLQEWRKTSPIDLMPSPGSRWEVNTSCKSTYRMLLETSWGRGHAKTL